MSFILQIQTQSLTKIKTGPTSQDWKQTEFKTLADSTSQGGLGSHSSTLYTHRHTRTLTCTHTHAHSRTHSQARTHNTELVHTHTHTLRCTFTQVCTCTHMHIHINSHVLTHALPHMLIPHTHTRMYLHALTPTH